MSFKGLPFFVGGRYRDRAREYTVTAMDKGRIAIKYDDGSTQQLSEVQAQTKARIYRNIISEYKHHHPVMSKGYFWTIGFLSANGRFEAELPARSVSAFLDHYAILSGEHISSNHVGVFLLGDVDKWGPELRIYFPAKAVSLDFGPNVDVRAGQTSDILRINNNALWFRLVGVGFRLGQNHNLKTIRGSIPPEMLSAFDSGRRM